MATAIEYYPWKKVLSFDARLNLLITARGRGKTYGFRKQAINDYKNGKWRFVEVVRYGTEIPDVLDGYFDKLILQEEFPQYVFRTEASKSGGKFFIARKPANEDDKPKWDLLGYCVALNAQQRKKKKTFAHVKRVLFDEFILEKNTRTGYLPREYAAFVKLIDSIAREIPGEPTPVRIYLCANACDLVNPYFVEFGINDEPREGFSWIDKGYILLHYEMNEAYTEAKRETLVGRLSRGHIEDMITNRFENANRDFIEKKPKDAKYLFAFVFQGRTYGVWVSYVQGYYYISDRVPKNADNVYSLTREDTSPNLINAKRTSYKMKTLIDMYYSNCVRYSSAGIREGFLKMTSLFGVR